MTRLAVIVALAGALLFTIVAPDTARDAVRVLFSVATLAAAAGAITYVVALVLGEARRPWDLRMRMAVTDEPPLRLVPRDELRDRRELRERGTGSAA
jgi:hypothetical protein